MGCKTGYETGCETGCETGYKTGCKTGYPPRGPQGPSQWVWRGGPMRGLGSGHVTCGPMRGLEINFTGRGQTNNY